MGGREEESKRLRMKERTERKGRKAGDTPDKRSEKRMVRMRKRRVSTGWEGGPGERGDVKGRVGRGEGREGVVAGTLYRDECMYEEEGIIEGGEEGGGELQRGGEGEGDDPKEEWEDEGYSEGGEGIYPGGGMPVKPGLDGDRSRRISASNQEGT